MPIMLDENEFPLPLTYCCQVSDNMASLPHKHRLRSTERGLAQWIFFSTTTKSTTT